MKGSIRYIDRSKLHRLLQFKLPNLLSFTREGTSYALFSVALLLNFFASIHVVYFWAVEAYMPLLTMPLNVLALLISRTIPNSPFQRNDFFFPLVLSIVVPFYQNIVNAMNWVPYFLAIMYAPMFYALFRLNKDLLRKTSTIVCKILALFLLVSMFFFFLYLIGYHLPGSSLVRGSYSYTNHYFFLLDDRDLWLIIPRFHSVFMEPGHMGTTIVLLLATQIGEWKRWYNRILFFALFISFSLAAYGLLAILTFLRLWILRRKILIKGILLISFIAAVIGGSFLYNDGDNMLNQLIVMRLEMTDTGDDFEGNNRVSENFKKEFESYITTGDVLFGRDMPLGVWGNSGYRVYIYDFGLFGFLLVLIFYFFSFKSGKDIRCIVSAFILSLVNFWIRGYPLLMAFYLPYFILSQFEIDKDITRKPLQRDEQ